ncbi:hypothetical protein COLO4_33818 [Corchorus olitorius]|uniref:Uncharacterized protein n=1 Tax=Corchorus olitorius TaxID=93759 RepID=A0A1R3GR38_9ROSI|nr:hypothetical protein COLO4_33818 [Corchorus olitorius]
MECQKHADEEKFSAPDQKVSWHATPFEERLKKGTI